MSGLRSHFPHSSFPSLPFILSFLLRSPPLLPFLLPFTPLALFFCSCLCCYCCCSYCCCCGCCCCCSYRRTPQWFTGPPLSLIWMKLKCPLYYRVVIGKAMISCCNLLVPLFFFYFTTFFLLLFHFRSPFISLSFHFYFILSHFRSTFAPLSFHFRFPFYFTLFHFPPLFPYVLRCACLSVQPSSSVIPFYA